ncbi:sigma-54-dependent Fis family transcriptional regulator [bacterium]|nr:sigma-54-dependent Fis family transcriptional regulator [bacterium]
MALILILDDDGLTLQSMQNIVERMGHTVKAFQNRLAASQALHREQYDVVITDLFCPNKDDGLSFASEAHEMPYKPAVMMVTGFSGTENVIEAMKSGADDFLPKGFSSRELQSKVKKIIDFRRREQWFQISNHFKDKRLRREFGDYKIVGMSAAMKQVRRTVEKIAKSSRIVCLIEGETGTGKELVARSIHEKSTHQEGAFASINCTDLTDDSFEQELFGFEKRAFPGANSSQKGKLELTHQGSLYLDSVAHLSMRSQAKLLKIFEKPSFNRLGGLKPIYSDVFIIASCTQPLATSVATGCFREDVYFRLKVVQLHIPPLREHKDDIPLLVETFLNRFNSLHQRSMTISSAALSLLGKYDFPGNVRELKNLLESAFILAEGEVIEPSDLEIENIVPKEIKKPVKPEPVTTTFGGNYNEMLMQFERQQLNNALNQNNGDIVAAAQSLDLPEDEFRKKLTRLKINL